MTTVATPDRMNRMNTTLVMRPEQPASADAMAALSLPSRRGDSLHAPQRPISMASNPRMHASRAKDHPLRGFTRIVPPAPKAW